MGLGLIRAGVDIGLENLLVGMLCNGWNLWVLPKSGVEGFWGDYVGFGECRFSVWELVAVSDGEQIAGLERWKKLVNM